MSQQSSKYSDLVKQNKSYRSNQRPDSARQGSTGKVSARPLSSRDKAQSLVDGNGQDLDEVASYHSMTISQRVTFNNQKMMQESREQTLPDINKGKDRVQSATKRSTASLRASAQFSEKNGPIRAVHEPSKFGTDKSPTSRHEIDSRYSSVQIMDKNIPKKEKLEPIAREALKTASQARRGSRMSQQDYKRSRSSQKLSDKSKAQARSGVALHDDEEVKTVIPPSSLQHASNTTMKHLHTDKSAGYDRAGSSELQPVINLDLHQVAIQTPDQIGSKSGISNHDQEATVMSNTTNKNRVTSQGGGRSISTVTHVSSPPAAKPRKKRVNQFKANKMSHEEIISFLFDLSSQSVGLSRKQEPTDLDSTQGLDSFLSAIIYINEHNIQKKDQKLVDSLHMSTGTRTNFCFEVLNFIIKQQAKETIFIDAVEFFQESLEHLLEVENENMRNKKLVEELTQSKTELTMMRFDLQNKLKETSNALLKLRQTQYEQSLVFADAKNHLEAKRAECESLHYRLKHLGFGVGDSIPSADGGQHPSEGKSLGGSFLQKTTTQEGAMDQSRQELIKINSSQKLDGSDRGLAEPSAASVGSVNAASNLDDAVRGIQDGLEEQVRQFKQMKQDLNPDAPKTDQWQRLQDMLNQTQIENKNLSEEANALKIRLDAKDRLVSHLENKVTHIMLENEDTILKLKSEIVLHKNQIDSNQNITDKKLMQMRERVEGENSKTNGQKITELTEKSDKLDRQNNLQQTRIEQLTADYKVLHGEFEKYRTDTLSQEQIRDSYVADIEKKLASLSKNHVNAKSSLGDTIKSLENNLEQRTKENQILYLRLRYMRQTSDVLLRQKHFLHDTLMKSKQELETKMKQLESSMLSQNKNKSYLVSVEKAIKQSRNVAEISKSAMSNILKIVNFFKVEKMHQLVFQTEKPTSNTLDMSVDNISARSHQELSGAERPYSEVDSQEIGSMSGGEFHLEKISALLTDLKGYLDLPVNFKPRVPEQMKGSREQKQQQKATKTEEYTLEYSTTELVSALLKVIVEIMIRLKVVDSPEQIPFSISRLLYLASNRSDQNIEKEIFEQFFLESNKIITQEVNHFQDKVVTFEKIQDLIPKFGEGIKFGAKRPSALDIELIEDSDNNTIASQLKSDRQLLEVSPTIIQIQGKKPLTMMQQTAILQKQKLEAKATSARGTVTDQVTMRKQFSESNQSQQQKSKTEVLGSLANVTQRSKVAAESMRQMGASQGPSLSKRQMQNELEILQLSIQEQKQQNKQIQQGLAEKIIKLEETIDFIKEEHESKLSAAEFSYRQELDTIKLGTIQREKQLLLQIEQLQDRNTNLELHPDNNIQTSTNNKQSSTMLKSHNSSTNRFKADNLRQAASVHSLVQQLDNENKENLQALEKRMETYRSNVKEFVRIRESTHGTISLVFEAATSNVSMINDSMIAFYLSRIFHLPKEKFRFLRTYNFQLEREVLEMQRQRELKTPLHSQDAPIEMVKVVVEIIEDHSQIRHDLHNLKTAVRDGSSLLYDLLPAYISINMGHSGLATSSEISNCALIDKLGKQINGVDFVLSLLRSTINPYCFFVILLNLERGEEYCIELDESDIMSLTEGDRGLLEDSEPIDLQNLIIDNLELIERDEVMFLTCAQKIFFNQLWHGIMTSPFSQHSQHQKPSRVSEEHDVKVRGDIEAKKINPQFLNTAVRDIELLKNRSGGHRDVAPGFYKKLLMTDAGCQTDIEGSLLYDAMVTVYRGHKWLNQEIKIDMEVQQSQNENLATMIFKESKTSNSAKFCVFNRLPNINITSMAKTEETDDAASLGIEQQFEQRMTGGSNGQNKSQYIIHSEVIIVGKDHLVMVCVERIQNDGFLVKLHDLKQITSDEFYLVRKPNGHLTRLNLSQNLQLMYQEEFRNLIFDLAFAQQTQSQDLMLQNLTYAAEKMQAFGKSPNQVTQELYNMAGGASLSATKQAISTQVKLLKDFKSEALVRTTKNQHESMRKIEWRSLGEKGLLLFRDVKFVRTNFEQSAAAAQTQNQSPPHEDVQESLISFYLKEEQISIEVFLFNDEDKMSINTNVLAQDLFGRDPSEIPFNERVNLLDQMLEKLFVLQQEGRFHMKVENQADPITQVLKQIEEKNSTFDELYKSTSAMKRRQFSDQVYEDKIREIQMEKNAYVKSGKARFFQRYITQNSISFSVNIFVITKQKKAMNKQSTKRLNTVGKTQQQIEAQKIEIFLDENGEFDQIYIETHHPITDDNLFLLIDRRLMAKILTRDITCDWRKLITLWSHDLMDYMFKNIILDVDKRKIDIYNAEDITELLVTQCRAISGGQILKKSENLVVDGFEQESSKLLQKTLVMNEEVDFTEICYDIKLFKISRASPFGSGNLQVGAETLSYHIEIFNVNQPDIVYKHRIPVQQTTTSNVHDPLTLVVDVFNLIDNPLIDNLGARKDNQNGAASETKSASTLNNPKSRQERKNVQSTGEVSAGSRTRKSDLQQKSSINDDTSADHQTLTQDNEAKLADERSQIDQVMKEHSTKYQLLFKKYIDNQLILVIQESKFPASISFTLVEPSSRLTWKSSYQPTTEIVSPSSFSIVDQGAFETFMTVVYDAVVPDTIITRAKSGKAVKTRGDWHNIPPKDSLMVSETISDSIHITIKKDVGKLRVLLQNPKLMELSRESSDLDEFQNDVIESIPSTVLGGQKFSGLNIVIQRNRGVYFKAKVLNLDDSQLEKSAKNAYVLMINCEVDFFSVSVIELHTQISLFHFKFKHQNPLESDIYRTPITQVNPLYRLEDIRIHLLDAIKNLNSEHLQEQIESNHIRIQQQKTLKKAGIPQEEQDSRIQTFEHVLFKVTECPAHQQRFYQRKYNQEKVVTLHRKIYYDETMEKLIIITANIRYVQGLQRLDNPMLLNDDISEIEFKILEPEHNTLTCLNVSLSHCFNDRQLMALNKKDLLRLKSLVRIVLEERSDIRRKEMDQDQQHHAYTLYITPQPDDQFIDDTQIARSENRKGPSDQMHTDQNMYMQQQHQQQVQQQHQDSQNGELDDGPMDDMDFTSSPQLQSQDHVGIEGGENGAGDEMNEMHYQQQHQQNTYENQHHPQQQQQVTVGLQQDLNSAGGSQKQRGQTNSVIIEEASQEDKEMEVHSIGGSVFHQSQKSSADGVTPLKHTHGSVQSLPDEGYISPPMLDPAVDRAAKLRSSAQNI